jgi:hypothetical protein
MIARRVEQMIARSTMTFVPHGADEGRHRMSTVALAIIISTRKPE